MLRIIAQTALNKCINRFDLVRRWEDLLQLSAICELNADTCLFQYDGLEQELLLSRSGSSPLANDRVLPGPVLPLGSSVIAGACLPLPVCVWQEQPVSASDPQPSVPHYELYLHQERCIH